MKNFFKSKTIQASIIGVIGIVLGAILTLTFQYWNPFSQVTETKQYYMVPDDNLVPDTTKLQQADCWENSLASNRSDAFRCMVGDHIYDPCFSSEMGDIVACPFGKNNDFDYFSVTNSKLPKYSSIVNDNRDKAPWLIKLDDNTECSLMTGTVSIISNMTMDYGCNNKKYTGLILPLIQSGPIQKIKCDLGTEITTCTIKELWY